MALDNITLADGQGTPVNHTFSYVQSLNGKVVRSDLAAPIEEPLILTFGHMARKIGQYPGQAHLARFDKTVLDADGVTPHVNNIRIMADIADRVVSDALADDLAAFVRNLLTSAFFRTFIRGSVG